MFTLRTLAFAILALVLGIIGLTMVFSDVGAGESATIRIVVATLFFFFSGLAIGYFNPRGWIVSGLSAWGGVTFGTFLVYAAINRYGSNAFAAREPPYILAGLGILLLPLSLALLGGYVGRRLREKRATRSAL